MLHAGIDGADFVMVGFVGYSVRLWMSEQASIGLVSASIAFSIRFNRQDIRSVDQDSLRSAIGVVSQQVALLNRSVRDNILLVRTDVSDDELHETSRRASAHEFITGLKDSKGRTGYDAHVGERGVKLSGGQRQRIALARVILKDAPILVLDEATANVDLETDNFIQRKIKEK